MDELFSQITLDSLLKLFHAFAAGALVGMQRERAEKPAGLRTHILVCIGSALITIVSIEAFGRMGSDPARITAQIVSGIGFLGAGTILRFGASVTGLTTAASLWAICGIGIAMGSGMYVVGYSGVGFILLVLVVLEAVDKKWGFKGLIRLEILCTDRPGVLGDIGNVLGQMGADIRHIKLEKATAGTVMLHLWIHYPSTLRAENVISGLQELSAVQKINLY